MRTIIYIGHKFAEADKYNGSSLLKKNWKIGFSIYRTMYIVYQYILNTKKKKNYTNNASNERFLGLW